MRALHTKGYIVSDDIPVVGVDNISFCGITDPPLTTMCISQDFIGERAVEILMARTGVAKLPNEKIQITGEMVLRKSTVVPWCIC